MTPPSDTGAGVRGSTGGTAAQAVPVPRPGAFDR
jgi:hypothetical protein